MGNSLITRRFVRIKALQYLYAYIISQQAYKAKAITQIEEDFLSNNFLQEPSQKAQSIQEAASAVKFFCSTIEKSSIAYDFTGLGSDRIAQSVRHNLRYYEQACRQNQALVQNGWQQSQSYIYMDCLYILLLLVEWHRMARVEADTSKLTVSSLKEAVAQHPLLKRLSQTSHWFIPVEDMHWPIAQDSLHAWYIQAMQPAKLPNWVESTVPSANNVKLLEYIVQTVILNNMQVVDFLAMRDIHWETHEPIVKTILMYTFGILAREGLDAFTFFWQTLKTKWAEAASFYKRLVQFTIEDNASYEARVTATAEKWASERILLVDKLILKLALTELLRFEEIPTKVSINEYVEIAKLYGTAKSSAFVNGMLEALFRNALKEEMK